MKNSQWSLKHVSLSKILGYYDVKEFNFHDGLQVIRADNHTGKTSFATAMVWGLTGQLPDIDRIASVQFKLKHKLAGDKDEARIQITLADNEGNQLVIRRSTASSTKSAKISISYNSDIYEGAQAQEFIQNQLGIKANSLEGCCVVLQDQHLSLITGDVKKKSGIIHDILGLSTLSKLLPIVTKRILELSNFIREIEGVDPLKKWKEEHQKLGQDLKQKEMDAVEKGYDQNLFSSSEFLDKIFNKFAVDLKCVSFSPGTNPREFVPLLLAALESQRNQNQHHTQFTKLSNELAAAKTIFEKMDESQSRFLKAQQHYPVVYDHAPLYQNDIPSHLKKVEDMLSNTESAIEAVNAQHGLFTHSLNLLNHTPDSNVCPLCQQSVNHEQLVQKIMGNLNDSTRKSLEEYHTKLSALKDKKQFLVQHQMKYQSWEIELKQQLMKSLADIASVQLQDRGGVQHLEVLANGSALEGLEAICAAYKSIKEALTINIAMIENLLVQQNARKIEADKIHEPMQKSLVNASLYLLPIHELQQKLLHHEYKQMQEANKNVELTALLNETKMHWNDLVKFKEIMQNQEREKAKQVIKNHKDFVSRFFVQVSQHPYYDSIDITPEEDRGSVKYYFNASSSKSPDYTDNARHVLSGGDLSCASLGLVLSLTKGKSNRTNFLILDDPGESLDQIRVANLAKVLQGFSMTQTIILTHQNDLAAQLIANGASQIQL
ncbi:MAG TPA: AAA family ATPase [Parachlamydiaceae bacterium]|nr:AAA family ATPase [Parachlamydiaceae bacterium]